MLTKTGAKITGRILRGLGAFRHLLNSAARHIACLTRAAARGPTLRLKLRPIRDAFDRVALRISRLTRLALTVAAYYGRGLGASSSAPVRNQRFAWLHTNGCGDFTLLARDDWNRLRGYPEWPIFSWHLDSAFMYAASAHDVAEVALGAKYRIYHLDHSVGSGWSPHGAGQLFARLQAKGIPYLTDDDLKRWREQIAANPRLAIVNGPAWGLANHVLPERQILHRLRSADRHERMCTCSADLPLSGIRS
jgi:hypothetical protein